MLRNFLVVHELLLHRHTYWFVLRSMQQHNFRDPLRTTYSNSLFDLSLSIIIFFRRFVFFLYFRGSCQEYITMKPTSSHQPHQNAKQNSRALLSNIWQRGTAERLSSKFASIQTRSYRRLHRRTCCSRVLDYRQAWSLSSCVCGAEYTPGCSFSTTRGERRYK